jgi:hypothetical protein
MFFLAFKNTLLIAASNVSLEMVSSISTLFVSISLKFFKLILFLPFKAKLFGSALPLGIAELTKIYYYILTYFTEKSSPFLKNQQYWQKKTRIVLILVKINN